MAELTGPQSSSHTSDVGWRARLFPACIAALLVLAFVLAGRGLLAPGLYYDEAVQARPALEFVTGRVHATPLPGSQGTWLGRRKFPLMTQPYMGALKSQALIPSLFFARDRGDILETLRLTTLVWALAGLAVVAAFSRRAFGAATALTATALLCFDPSFLLLACHDWGSFSLSFLLRGVTLWCGWRWWESRRTAWLWTAAFTTGLAFYNKVDIVIFASAVGIALLVVAAKPLSRAWLEEPRAGRTAAGACVAFAIGLAPMFPALPAVFAARNAFAEPNELAEKLHTLWTMLDGSYFHRLMATGGIFGADSLGQVADAQASALPIALLLGVAWLLYRIATAPAGQRDPRALFLLLSSALSILGVMALPGAVRIHHAMNVYPLLHWLVAYALVDAARALSGEATSERRPGRMIALGALWTLALAVVASQWRTFDHTVSRYQQSGGKGRWSNAIHAFAATLDEDFEGTVSSLDWGFHEPLALLSRGGTFRESHWQIPRALRERPAWVIVGEPGDYYILHLAPYDRSGFGRLFVSAVAEANDDRITALEHLDGDGDVAFVTVRVEAPHRVSFAGTATGEGAFKIELGP